MDNDLKEKVNEHLFVTNNIAESLHQKINFNLPKRKTTSFDFITSIQSILYKNFIKIENIKRRDYITQALINISININNNNFEWIQLEDFKNKETKIISSKNSHLKNNLLEEFIKTVNDIEEDSIENNIIENNSQLNNIDLEVEDISDNNSSESNDDNSKSKHEELEYDILS